MDGLLERIARLVVAAGLIPALAWVAYTAARAVDGDPTKIDQNGSALGVTIMMASVFAISRVASPERWTDRAGVSLGLSATYFFITWQLFGDPSAGVDDAPHLVWFGACVAAFSPAVVLIVASKWVWESIRERRASFASAESPQTK